MAQPSEPLGKKNHIYIILLKYILKEKMGWVLSPVATHFENSESKRLLKPKVTATSNGQPLSFPAASNHSVELRQVNAGAEHQSNHTWKADTYKLGSTEQPTLAHPTGEGRAESKAGSRRR